MATGINTENVIIKFDSAFNTCEPEDSLNGLTAYVSIKPGITNVSAGRFIDTAINIQVFNSGTLSNECGILPVTLLSFTAQKQSSTVQLQWQTANEINNSYFSIERSANGGLFTSIAQQAALKTSAVNNYAFTDNAPLQGNNYYRLKQVDKDGKFTYSNIVTVEFATALLFSVSPNPATDFINIVSAGTVADAAVTITDMNGRTLYTGKQNFVAHQPVKIPASQFAKQVLVVTVNAANSRQVFKVVKE